MTRSPLLTLAAAALLALAAAGCGGSDAEEASDQVGQPEAGAAVTIDTFIFRPDPLEVEAGTTVEFTNEDDILHTVTEGKREKPVKGGFDLQLDGAGTSGEITLDEPGTIPYVCTIHAGMDGTLIVR